MDAVLAELVREAEADPDTVAVVLGGSRSVGHDRPDSDYDVYFVRLVGTKRALMGSRGVRTHDEWSSDQLR